MNTITYLDLACLLFLGEQTEQESSEQLLTELAEAERRQEDLEGGGDRGRAGLEDRVADEGGGERLLLAGDRPTGDRRAEEPSGERRLFTDGDERRGGGDRGDLLRPPTGDRRVGGGDRGERGERLPPPPVCGERERLRRLGDGDDEQSMYIDL